VDRFDRNDERLEAFTRKVWDALVPPSGECASVQGEMVRAHGRLTSEHYRNGMGNYYTPDEESHGFADGHYPGLLVYVLTKLIENANAANDALTVDWFRDVLARAPRDWALQQRINDINEREHEEGRDLTDEELAEIDALDEDPSRLAWEEVLDRIEIAVANYLLANPLLVARAGGQPIEEGGVKDIRHIFDPPPAPPPCPLCNGKGWLAPADASQFPAVCSCKTPKVLH
jgi:hypothetical protein